MAKTKSPEKPAPAGFLSGLDAKLAALQELRESYLRAVSVGAIGDTVDFGSGAIGPVGGASRGNDQPVELPTGAFLNKSIPEAIKLLFVATKRKYGPSEVAAALREGGYESTSQNFEKTVSGTMYRMKDQGILLKFKDGFGLAELYPDHLRAKLAEASKPTKAKRNKKPRAVKTAAKAVKPTPKAERAPKPRKAEPATGKSLDAEILAILDGEGPIKPSALVERFGRPSNIIGLALGRLANRGQAERQPTGEYAAVRTH